ncbi:hypothetical protein niasHS_000767 [Heterodera schachtii]|uniref:PI3K/PI4K catalytic domain-containing protein n=1 Tax=Heterodera schachtii TaxID=97005 RepID=A0ABD2KMD5_HETSC
MSALNNKQLEQILSMRTTIGRLESDLEFQNLNQQLLLAKQIDSYMVDLKRSEDTRWATPTPAGDAPNKVSNEWRCNYYSLDNDGHFDGTVNHRSLTNNSLSHLTSLDHCHALDLSSKLTAHTDQSLFYAFGVSEYEHSVAQRAVPFVRRVGHAQCSHSNRPAFQCRTVAVADCAIFNSLTKPIKRIINGRRGQFGFIYKAGDALRQDAVVLQLVRAMNDIWLSVQLDLRMVLFRCLPTGSKKGLMIELVPSCKTLREIQIVSSGAVAVFKDEVLNEWLARQNPYEAALENVRRSCVGWCVATYVLGIGDRHNDNILATCSTSTSANTLATGKWLPALNGVQSL